jgi:hypothetical protein
MTYARSYATNRKPQRLKRFRRTTNKRKIPKLHFRQNTYRSRAKIWPHLKACFLTAGCLIGALTVLAGFSLMLGRGVSIPAQPAVFHDQKSRGHYRYGRSASQPGGHLAGAADQAGYQSAGRAAPKSGAGPAAAALDCPAAELTRVWPDQVRVVIREHEPVALVKIADKLYLMDRRGVLFKRLEPHDPHEFPVITGLELEHFQRVGGALSPLLAKVFDFLELLQEKDNYLTPATVGDIHIDGERGFTIYPTEFRISG